MSRSGTATKQRGRPFAKGQSGNPGGRPRGSGIAGLVRERTADGVEPVEVLLKIMRDKKAAKRDRIKAAEVLLDRGWGKPQQQVEVTTPPVADLSKLTVDQLREVRALLALESAGQTLSPDQRRRLATLRAQLETKAA